MNWKDILRSFEIECSEAEVKAFEDRIGFTFPEGFRDFVLSVNGGAARFDNTVFVDEHQGEIELSCIYPIKCESNEYADGFSDLWHKWNLQGSKFLPFGDNNGGGYFFIGLFGKCRDGVFYSDGEDFFGECFSDGSPILRCPQCFIKVSEGFEAFRSMITPD